jgi:hypothetical protein
MQYWFGVAAAVLGLAVEPALAADVATCTLGADQKTVTVTANNPYSQVMACEVTCDMAIPDGISSITCAKPVPVGAKDFVICTRSAQQGHVYTRVKGVDANCPDPAAPPAQGKKDEQDEKASKDEDDDDKSADELMQKMQKMTDELLRKQKQK